jgi:membrane protein implicated in regulation of membrane protease activity
VSTVVDLSPRGEPRVDDVAAGVFLLVIGLPAALFFYAGRMQVALGLLAIFALMVLATAYALHKAMEAEDSEDA